jgi:hypothetical protein
VRTPPAALALSNRDPLMMDISPDCFLQQENYRKKPEHLFNSLVIGMGKPSLVSQIPHQGQPCVFLYSLTPTSDLRNTSL